LHGGDVDELRAAGDIPGRPDPRFVVRWYSLVIPGERDVAGSDPLIQQPAVGGRNIIHRFRKALPAPAGLT
jgi:hypothetical protein